MEDVTAEPAADPGPRRRFAAWALPIGLYVAITIQSSFALAVPNVDVPFGDKLAHALVYGILGALVARALRRGVVRPPSTMTAVVVVVVIASVLGALDELHQAFVPGRSPDVLDGLADVVGAGLGASLYGWASSRRDRR